MRYLGRQNDGHQGMILGGRFYLSGLAVILHFKQSEQV